MKLRALELEQFRKFERPVRLSGFGDRVNVIGGPNEFGKSTLLVAIRGLLFERHNSRADPIKRMQTWRGNAAPRLAMEFETGGGCWRIEKRFLHQPMARLTAPDGSRFDNDAAEEELQRLLGFGASGKTGAKPEQMGVWGALWVTQRDSCSQADLSSDLTRATITSCLDAEVGVLTGNEKGQAVIRIVREQRAQLLDGRGKPRGRFAETGVLLAAADAKLADLSLRAKRLGEDAIELRRLADMLAREADPAAEQVDRDALADARRRREAALLYEQRSQSAQAELALAERKRQDAEREVERRAARLLGLAASEKAVAAEGTAQERAAAALAEAQGEFDRGREAAQAAQTRATAGSTAARQRRANAELLRKAGGLAVQQDILQQADAAAGRLADLTARLGLCRVDIGTIEAIRTASRECQTARAVLDAQATQLVFDLLAGAAGRVSVDRRALDSGASYLAVFDETEIAIEGIGRITVRPAIRDRAKLDRARVAAEHRLDRALEAAGCRDAAEAERLFAAREAMQRALNEACSGLARLVPGEPRDNLAPGIDALRSHVDLLARRLREEGWVRDEASAASPDSLAGAEEAAREVARAEEEELAAAEHLKLARAEADGAADRRSELREALARADGRTRAAAEQRVRLLAEAGAAEAAEPSAALAVRLEEAHAEVTGAGAGWVALQRGRSPDSAEGMQARIERYEQALAGRQSTIRRLRESLAEVRARISQEGGYGLDEQIACLQRDREGLALEQHAYLRETSVLNLLLKTLDEAERETKERYLAPVIRRVTPYLRSLFPGADISCDEALRITGLTRELLGTEEFDRLSDGTQEQIAVLARLAFAEMLIDRGKPAMVILDDALAFSDAERMERMFDILTQASSKMQILVLTCRQDLFTRLGGQRVELTQLGPACEITPSARTPELL